MSNRYVVMARIRGDKGNEIDVYATFCLGSFLWEAIPMTRESTLCCFGSIEEAEIFVFSRPLDEVIKNSIYIIDSDDVEKTWKVAKHLEGVGEA